MQFTRKFQGHTYHFSLAPFGEESVLIYSSPESAALLALAPEQVTAFAVEASGEPLRFLSQAVMGGLGVARLARVIDAQFNLIFTRLARAWTYLARAVEGFNGATAETCEDVAQDLDVKLAEYNAALVEVQAFAARQFEAGNRGWYEAAEVWTKHDVDSMYDADLERMGMPEFVLHLFVKASRSARVEVQTIVCSATLEGDYRVEDTVYARDLDHAAELAQTIVQRETQSVDVTRRMVFVPDTGVSYWWDGKKVNHA